MGARGLEISLIGALGDATGLAGSSGPSEALGITSLATPLFVIFPYPRELREGPPRLADNPARMAGGIHPLF